MSGALHIEKRGYSRGPWRIVDDDGRELYKPVPGLSGAEPHAYATKAEAIVALGSIAGRLLDLLDEAAS